MVVNSTGYYIYHIWRSYCRILRIPRVTVYLHAVLDMSFVYRLFIFVLCVCSLPLVACIAFVSLLISGFPIFFSQMRIGKGGKPFRIYKFRTMRVGSEKLQSKLRTRNESDGPVFKIVNDPRFTVLGKFLAHTGLDELPQLYNVLVGDMALFGPRPIPIAEAAKLKPWQQKRHTMKPGILSPAILTGKYHENFDEWMKSDVAYTKEKSILYDTQLISRAMRFLIQLFIRETNG